MDTVWYPLDLADCTLEPTARRGGLESSHDSPLEEAGFELDVPLARKDGSRGGRGRGSIKVASKGLSLSSGTSGSNPLRRVTALAPITIARAVKMRPAGNAPFQTFLPELLCCSEVGVVRIGDR